MNLPRSRPATDQQRDRICSKADESQKKSTHVFVSEMAMAETVCIAPILEAARVDEVSRALELSSALLKKCGDCPYLLVLHSILIRHNNSEHLSHTLQEAEESLLRAHAVDRSYLPALEELAHYYDAVDPNPEKARAFAAAYIEKGRKVLDGMQTIVDPSV
jgi:hypothetical protein